MVSELKKLNVNIKPKIIKMPSKTQKRITRALLFLKLKKANNLVKESSSKFINSGNRTNIQKEVTIAKGEKERKIESNYKFPEWAQTARNFANQLRKAYKLKKGMTNTINILSQDLMSDRLKLQNIVYILDNIPELNIKLKAYSELIIALHQTNTLKGIRFATVLANRRQQLRES
jgi:hypothetical protein